MLVAMNEEYENIAHIMLADCELDMFEIALDHGCQVRSVIFSWLQTS